MGFKVPGQSKVEAESFIRASVYTDANDVWIRVQRALEEATYYDYEESEPSVNQYSDDRVFKITITVEEV